ncbi:MAG TPA: methylated-DNA--[protein]-cysteine S-methyltransferase [Bacteroidia bacterium]|nr:methylated-DNA--[protein]-cysteine S-methyltransferase [Bacteroidia bacterium]
MSIYQSILESPLGPIRITSDGDFVNEVHFLEEGETLSPEAKSKDPLLEKCKSELSAFFEGNLTVFSVPVKQEGTEFQQEVWTELLDIPCGKTISYLELSKRIGDVKAIRAVGTSNGKNKIAIIVPCHRVIGTNGSLTGYSGGLRRKQWLLEHEMKVVHGVMTLF